MSKTILALALTLYTLGVRAQYSDRYTLVSAGACRGNGGSSDKVNGMSLSAFFFPGLAVIPRPTQSDALGPTSLGPLPARERRCESPEESRGVGSDDAGRAGTRRA